VSYLDVDSVGKVCDRPSNVVSLKLNGLVANRYFLVCRSSSRQLEISGSKNTVVAIDICLDTNGAFLTLCKRNKVEQGTRLGFAGGESEGCTVYILGKCAYVAIGVLNLKAIKVRNVLAGLTLAVAGFCISCIEIIDNLARSVAMMVDILSKLIAVTDHLVCKSCFVASVTVKLDKLSCINGCGNANALRNFDVLLVIGDNAVAVEVVLGNGELDSSYSTDNLFTCKVSVVSVIANAVYRGGA
jgi:hypothetical protein